MIDLPLTTGRQSIHRPLNEFLRNYRQLKFVRLVDIDRCYLIEYNINRKIMDQMMTLSTSCHLDGLYRWQTMSEALR